MESLNDFNGYNETFLDYDGYTTMKTYWMDQHDQFLTIRLSDYPDHNKVEEYINDIFTDYLY
jgi:hypothetical protein